MQQINRLPLKSLYGNWYHNCFMVPTLPYMIGLEYVVVNKWTQSHIGSRSIKIG